MNDESKIVMCKNCKCLAFYTDDKCRECNINIVLPRTPRNASYTHEYHQIFSNNTFVQCYKCKNYRCFKDVSVLLYLRSIVIKCHKCYPCHDFEI